MSASSKWIVSFRFKRRGQTNLWEQDRETRRVVPLDELDEEGDVWLAENDHKMEWINTKFVATNDDFEECYDRAQRNAVAKFRDRHPRVDLEE